MKTEPQRFILIPQQTKMHMRYYKGGSFADRMHLDVPISISILLLFVISILCLYSAKLEFSIINKQAIRMLLSVGLMIIVAHIPPRILKHWTIFLYILGLFILILNFGWGSSTKGAKRWLEIGSFRFQPSELMKLAVPMMIARLFDQHVLPPSLKMLLIAGGYIFVPVILIALQPDLGTAILVASSGCLVIFFSGIRFKQVIYLALIAVIGAPLFWSILKEYQKARILTLLNPENDPLGKGYQIIQSKIALGSGGIYGKGWLHGTQAHLEYLPEKTTDFIFAVFGEEFGFLGIIFLLGIYIFIIIRSLYIGSKAQDTFSRLLAGSIAMLFFVYIFVNIGMVVGILPVVGVPLPLISYGGTSLIIIMVSCGILMSIQSHRILVKK